MILCCPMGCKVTLVHQISGSWGEFLMVEEYLRTPAELRWAPSHLIGVKEMMRYLPSQGHPMVQWFLQTVPSIRNTLLHRAGEPDDFRAKRWPSQAIIPSFRGWRKSSVEICWDIGRSLIAMLNYFVGKLLSFSTQQLCFLGWIYTEWHPLFLSQHMPFSRKLSLYAFPLVTCHLQLINKLNETLSLRIQLMCL